MARASCRARFGLSIRGPMRRSYTSCRLVQIHARPRRAVALEVRRLDALGIEPERARVLDEEAAHVDRRRQLGEHLALERLQVRHADLRALGDLAQLDANC